MEGKTVSLPGEACWYARDTGKPGQEARLNRQESAEAPVLVLTVADRLLLGFLLLGYHCRICQCFGCFRILSGRLNLLYSCWAGATC